MENIEKMMSIGMEKPSKESSLISVEEALRDLSNREIWTPNGSCLIPTPKNPLYENYMKGRIVNC
jgi:hypothetical protein